MLASIRTVSSAGWTVRYFEKDGYYTKGDPEHRRGRHWRGSAAPALKLRGNVTPNRFHSILTGPVPKMDIRLGRLRDGKHEHRPGFDADRAETCTEVN